MLALQTVQWISGYSTPQKLAVNAIAIHKDTI